MNRKDPRYLRYQEKITFIMKNIQLLEHQPTNEWEKLGIFHICQTLIDAIIDTLAMITKDIGEEVQDDYSNIEILVKKEKISKSIGDQLKQANGMRNRLAHKYNGLNENLIMNSVGELIDLGNDWIEFLEDFLNATTTDE